MVLHGMGCPVCGTAIGQEDRFCRSCGHSLCPDAKSQERRHVAALCSDLCGYTSLSALLDQEELKDLMDAIFKEASRIITSFGGTVEKFLGDAVMALFGMHRTREDDLMRAIRSAILIHNFVGGKSVRGRPLLMHTGIHAGSVLVDRGHAAGRVTGVMGMPLIMATRLSGIAAPGEILVGGSSIHEAERFFRTEPLGGKDIKGLTGKTAVYRIVSQRDIPSGIHRPGSPCAPLVGRAAHLKALRDAHRSLSGGKGGQVFITGVPGAGKSRLALEFLNRLPGDVRTITTHCLDHMKDIPYYPVVSMIRQMIQPPGHLDAVADRTLEDLLENPRHAFHIRVLLGMKQGAEDLMPDVWKTGIAEAVSSLVQAFGRTHRLVICVEDFHWADPTSRDLILNLLPPETSSGCLLLVTSREDPLPSSGGIRVHVEELGREHMKPLLQGLLGSEWIPDETAAALHRITGGNPLYVEEYLSYLRDKAISPHHEYTGEVPSTVDGIIAARLESLGPDCKALLQAASVAGMIFSEALLRAVHPMGREFDTALAALVDTGFISVDRTGECSFRHALTREAAYASLLVHRRRELHRKIGAWLEGTPGGRAGNCGTIAYHLFHAREYREAYPCCMLAARTYQAEGAWMEAAAHYGWARECLLEDSPEDREERLVEVCEGIWSCSRIFSPDQAIAALEELASLHRRAGRTSQEAFSHIRLINLYSQKALFAHALETYEAVAPLSEGSGFLTAAAKTAVAYTFTFLGKPLKALGYLQEARACLDQPDRFLLLANHLTTLAACVWKGDVREALSWYVLTKDGSSPHMDFDLVADLWHGYVLFLKGDIGLGMQVLEEVRAREKKLGCLAGGLSYLRIQSSIYLCARYTGSLDTAREDLALAQAQGSGDTLHAPLLGLYRAWIALESGQFREAAACAERVLPSLERGTANRVPYALNTLAESLSMLGSLSSAEEAATSGILWNTEHGNLDQLVWSLRILARIRLAQGEDDACAESLLKASRLARDSGMLPHAAWNLAVWGDYHALRGNPLKAGACYRRAHALWGAMGCPYQAMKIQAKQALQAHGKAS